MSNDFNRVIDRRNTESTKWDYTMRTFGREDVLPMWVADMDFPSPTEVEEAIRKRLDHGIFGYTEIPDSYKEAVMAWQKSRNGWKIEKEWLVHSPGVVTSFTIAVLAFTNPGDRVLIQPPVYPPFYAAIQNHGRSLVTNPLVLENGRYGVDFADLENKLGGGVKMMILCSPHNPVGRVWTKEELSRVVELCRKYRVLLVSDEIHSDLVYRGYRHIPAASLVKGNAGQVITCISPTKTFNLAGLATSMVVIEDELLRQRFEKEMHSVGAGMSNVFGVVGGEAAFRYGHSWVDSLMGYLEENLKRTLSFIRDRIPEIKAVVPEGTYLVWLDCRELNMTPEQLREFFVRKAGVGLNGGETFGEEGKGFQRINIACPWELLEEGLCRIERAVMEYRREGRP